MLGNMPEATSTSKEASPTPIEPTKFLVVDTPPVP
jgi:hypothetical protein